MQFKPEKYRIEDKAHKAFIDGDEIWDTLNSAEISKERVRAIIKKSLNKNRLNMAEVAVLVKADSPELISEIKQAARDLKERVYGNRIVLFAPLYVGNLCMNNCKYCGFKASNTETVRKTLTKSELISDVKALEDNGQKRLILVYGEHKIYSPEFIAETVKTVYSVKSKNGEIRRVNINAAPMDAEGFKIVKDAGIGTYQIFQETYHKETYAEYHESGRKRDYDNRLTSLDTAQDVGLDDVGIGVLLGLYDWRFEMLALVRHTNHLEACYNVGPHTISFPRLQNAEECKCDPKYKVSDEDFARFVAILRLAVPYTGLILTAREPQKLRKEILQYGCSQVDAGTKIELGNYSDDEKHEQDLRKEQFQINDTRSLAEVIDELIEDEYLPSFCTACYRLGRTGEHFMEFSVPGFIKEKCTPNAIMTLAEYLIDYREIKNAEKGWQLINKSIDKMENAKVKELLKDRVARIKGGERDLYF
ncbi:MAG: [FeFe] hydrogenase H-cluster radical SAM maturase HydG [Bacteroidales bacterium]|nr:[FeFe] hydrogenase H-cluster radical SAM maturase HydG [Bacteroidales bacterium]